MITADSWKESRERYIQDIKTRCIPHREFDLLMRCLQPDIKRDMPQIQCKDFVCAKYPTVAYMLSDSEAKNRIVSEIEKEFLHCGFSITINRFELIPTPFACFSDYKDSFKIDYIIRFKESK